MSNTTRQLVLNVTTSNVWTQLKQLSDDSNYTVPVDAVADIRWLRALNFDVDETTVEFAISPDNSPTDAQRLVAPIPLKQNEQFVDDMGAQVPGGFALWARAVGTTPNMTFQAFLLEITP